MPFAFYFGSWSPCRSHADHLPPYWPDSPPPPPLMKGGAGSQKRGLLRRPPPPSGSKKFPTRPTAPKRGLALVHARGQNTLRHAPNRQNGLARAPQVVCFVYFLLPPHGTSLWVRQPTALGTRPGAVGRGPGRAEPRPGGPVREGGPGCGATAPCAREAARRAHHRTAPLLTSQRGGGGSTG